MLDCGILNILNRFLDTLMVFTRLIPSIENSTNVIHFLLKSDLREKLRTLIEGSYPSSFIVKVSYLNSILDQFDGGKR